MSAIDDLLNHAAKYKSSFPGGDLPIEPATGVTVLTCMDARIEPFRLLGVAEGDAHILRNAGGAVTQDVRRSLAVSGRLLGTTEIAVINHTGCGMLSLDDAGFRDAIEAETGFRPDDWPALRFDAVDDNVRRAVRLIVADPAIPHAVVRGFVFDVTDGSLREVT